MRLTIYSLMKKFTNTKIDAEKHIKDAKTIVIKIGSALLFDNVTNKTKISWVRSLISDIAKLHSTGTKVVLVSSGSIILGRQKLGMTKKPIRLEEKQAAAAVGQIELAQFWKTSFDKFDIHTAQILLAPDDTERRKRHINARITIQTLLNLNAIPIVNENDTVTTYEIRFGDNDRLAARVAGMISADLIILLTDIDGLYTSNPKNNPNATHIPEINDVTQKILDMGEDPKNEFASGGMITKLSAAKIATQSGVSMIICNGLVNNPLSSLMNGANFSYFHRDITLKNARKNWISGALDPKGSVKVDNGAKQAVEAGKSLLPVGVIEINGNFQRGDLISISSSNGIKLGHGLSGYSAEEANKIKGNKSVMFEKLLGYESRAELVHADNLVISKGYLNDD